MYLFDHVRDFLGCVFGVHQGFSAASQHWQSGSQHFWIFESHSRRRTIHASPSSSRRRRRLAEVISDRDDGR